MTEEQQQALELIIQMQITPQTFSYRWNAGYEVLAELCCTSRSNAYHWLGGQASRRVASRSHQRILALTDFMLSHTDQIQTPLEQWQHQQPD
ncbi:hypothetical protein [Phormidesmis sp. 146-33]